ncbi:hypothetical protein A2U01_0118102, partial [Trifolium medium]|nr:hypothetical protein [Trifolium medium]
PQARSNSPRAQTIYPRGTSRFYRVWNCASGAIFLASGVNATPQTKA